MYFRLSKRLAPGKSYTLDLGRLNTRQPSVQFTFDPARVRSEAVHVNHPGITWPITWVIGKATVPDAYSWPTAEAYWDLGGWPMLEEFTVDLWAPNLLVWGYLAARN